MSTLDAETVAAVMTTRVWGIVPGAGLETALNLMARHHVRHLPVIDGERCVGLLHESDVLWTLWSRGSARHTVAGCVRSPAPVVEVTESVSRVADRIRRSGGDAAVVTSGGRVVGIVTATDLVHYLARVEAGG